MRRIDIAYGLGYFSPRVILIELDLVSIDIGDDIDATKMVIVVETLDRSGFVGKDLNTDSDELRYHSVGINLIMM